MLVCTVNLHGMLFELEYSALLFGDGPLGFERHGISQCRDPFGSNLHHTLGRFAMIARAPPRDATPPAPKLGDIPRCPPMLSRVASPFISRSNSAPPCVPAMANPHFRARQISSASS